MERLIAEYPKNAEVIFPYIGCKEVNDSPTHAHHRYVINFGDLTEEECRRQWPELMAIVERKVKPERMENNREGYRRYWWQYAEKRGELASAVLGLQRVIVTGAAATQHLSFPFVEAGQVYSHKLIVFPCDQARQFACLLSRVHIVFAGSFSGTLEDRLTYNPTDCFETFPFPSALSDSAATDQDLAADSQNLESIGEGYHQFRAELMMSNNEGLTSTYNRFHDPAETSEGILELRRLHQQMDQAVLQSYGWEDIPTSCGFGLDYLDSDEDDTTLPPDLQERIASGDLFFPIASQACAFQSQLRQYGAVKASKKLPWRHRWPDAVRDDVLARLLALNSERYVEEEARGLHGKGVRAGAGGGGKRSGRNTKPEKVKQIGLQL